MFKPYQKKILATALLVGLIAASAYHFGLFFSFGKIFTDKLFQDLPANENIVIVAIDNQSISALGRWPWDRKIHADLLNKLSESQPDTIGLDVNFSESSDPASDDKLAEAIKDAGNVILPIEAELVITDNEAAARNLLSPLTIFKDAALAQGITNIPLDRDGIARNAPTLVASEGAQLSSFSYLIARNFLRKKSSAVMLPAGEAPEMMVINFRGRPGNFKTISSLDILNGKFSPAEIKNKIVLIGATAPDLHDEIMVPTSLNKPMSGVEVHANAVDTIINERFLKHLPSLWQELLLIIGSLIIGLILAFLKIKPATAAIFAWLVFYIIAAIVLFDYGFIIDIFYFLAIAILTYSFSVLLKYLSVEKEKKFIKNIFSRYVSPAIINELVNNPAKLKLGGERTRITILFSDIRGFTSISEKISPEKLVALLNEYFTVMTKIILSTNGLLDKFIGDAIMAFWGAPLPNKNQAALACETALLMHEQLLEKRSIWQELYGVEIYNGLGINTGEAIVGNLGSEERFDYTAIGDSVNLASRLEGLTKLYGVYKIVSEATKEEAGAKFFFRFLDKVKVKGKGQAVNIFELIDLTAKLDQATKGFYASYQTGVSLYQAKKWSEALKIFNALSIADPNDRPVQIYLERSNQLLKSSPADWNEVYELTEK